MIIYPPDFENKLKLFSRPTHLTALQSGYWMTDGIQYLVEESYSEWLLEKILQWLKYFPELRMQRFQIFVLKVDLETHQAVLEAHNEERQVLKKLEIEFTDFPLPWISIWVKDKILMLASEFAQSF